MRISPASYGLLGGGREGEGHSRTHGKESEIADIKTENPEEITNNP